MLACEKLRCHPSIYKRHATCSLDPNVALNTGLLALWHIAYEFQSKPLFGVHNRTLAGQVSSRKPRSPVRTSLQSCLSLFGLPHG